MAVANGCRASRRDFAGKRDRGVTTFLVYLLAAVSLTIFLHSCYSLYLTLYAWNDPRRLKPEVVSAPPQVSFTVLLPARHEEQVIADTIRRVCQANYPQRLLEVFVICSADDTGTIAAAQAAIDEGDLSVARVLVYSDPPINKPHGLNVGLRYATNDYIAIFDAEDDIHPEIFSAVNANVVREGSDVVQGPVQLMNYDSNWYSLFNVVEYFMWYNSRLRLQAEKTAVTLGGNTVFFRRQAVEAIGGWDNTCLTEDADVGIRLSALGATIRVLYDPALATQEETPHSIPAFIRQRTRWHQGFMQVLRKRDWLGLPSLGTLWLAFFTIFFPVFHGITTLLWPIAIFAIFQLDIPVAFAMVTYLPLYGLVLLYVINVAALWEFTRVYKLRFPPSAPIVMAITFLPYQWMLGISSIRALIRETFGRTGWEKTFHSGAHRGTAMGAPAMQMQSVRVTVDEE